MGTQTPPTTRVGWDATLPPGLADPTRLTRRASLTHGLGLMPRPAAHVSCGRGVCFRLPTVAPRLGPERSCGTRSCWRTSPWLEAWRAVTATAGWSWKT